MSSIAISGDTSGSITLAVPAVAGSNTITLPANTGTVITTASSGQVIPSGALPTGSVLQVVSSYTATAVSNSTTSYTDTGLTVSITPKFSTSKILCIVNMAGLYNGSVASLGTALRLLRNSTSIDQFAVYTNYTNANLLTQAGTNWLDYPATTSATTYKVQFAKSDATAGTIGIQQNNDYSTITVMEIAG